MNLAKMIVPVNLLLASGASIVFKIYRIFWYNSTLEFNFTNFLYHFEVTIPYFKSSGILSSQDRPLSTNVYGPNLIVAVI